MYPVAPEIPPQEPRGGTASAPLRVELPIPCSRCGYSLSGLLTTGRCPECAAPIRLSVFGDRLEYAAAGYVRVLHLGAWLVTLAVGVQLACTPTTLLALIVCEIFTMYCSPRWIHAAAWFVLFVLPGFTAPAAIAGWWLLTTPDPAHLRTSNDPRCRRVLRAILITEALCWLVLAGLGIGCLLTTVPPALYIPVSALCVVVAPLAILAHLLTATRLVRAMRARLESLFTLELCAWHTWITWAAVVSGGVFALAIVLANGAGGLMLLVLFPVLLAFTLLAIYHVALVGIVRRAASAALQAQRSTSKREPSTERRLVTPAR